MERRNFLRKLGIGTAAVITIGSVGPVLSHHVLPSRERRRNMISALRGTHNFTGDISAWDVSKVTDMREMFANCKT